MLKILYAAGNNENAKIQLSRFIQSIEGKPYFIKVAAYKKSSPTINIDWTLDSLLNMFNPEHISIDNNDNLITYFEQVKYFNPDLIISDLEYFTSYIANILNIELWQCSSLLLNVALTQEEKYNLGLFKNYSYLTNKNPQTSQRIIHMVDNSAKNFVYSHFGDTLDVPKIKDNFEWIRPYHQLGKLSIPCQHNIVAGMLSNNKKIFSLLSKYPDCVTFSEFDQESYAKVSLKSYSNQEEYFCNLTNCNLFVCEGQASFLADAFYNHKYSVIMPNLKDIECITNSLFSSKRGLSFSIYEETQVDLNDHLGLSVPGNKNDKIKFLHEHLEETHS